MELLAIFTEGLLSFFSPCVLPLVPLYISYLAGDSKQVDEQGNITYKQGKVFIMTMFFVLGICLTFVLLSITVNIVSPYLNKYNEIISIIGGTIIILFGLHHIGLIHIDILDKQHRINTSNLLNNMNYLKAFALGFVFSLGWSPCIGPMLANAILLATTNKNYLYIIIYGLGLVVPFIITGLFTTSILNFLNKKKNFLKYTLIIAGIIMIGFGLYMIYNASNNIVTLKNVSPSIIDSETDDHDHSTEGQSVEEIQSMLINHEFKNNLGESLHLADYEGKYIFLNFTTTWCTYCDIEMPHYEEFSKNEDVKCFYVMSNRNEYSDDAIEKFIEEKKPTVETIIDDEGLLFYYCSISGYPTTYVISPNGDFLVYASGALDQEGFNNLLDYAKEHTE